MYSLLRNHLAVKSLHQLSHSLVNSVNVFNPIRCLTHLNANNLLKFNQNNRICLQNEFDLKPNQRTFSTSNYYLKGIENYTSFDFMDGVVYKVRRYFGYTTLPRYRLQTSSVHLYESCTDAMDIEKFFKHLKLPDTFLSWFLVTQIHVWMCMTRAMSEGKEGRSLRNELVARMWDDTQNRLKKLTYLPTKLQKQGLDDLLQQFQAAIFAYDEGFLTDDKTLAAALWRTLFTYENTDPQCLETMVAYIRTQLDHLQTVGTETFFLEGKITWKHFTPLYP